MRITFILPFAALAGGVRVIATYARVLSEQGHDVYVLSAARSKRGRVRKMWLRMTGRKHKIKVKKDSPLLKTLGTRHILYDPDRPFDPNVVPDSDAVFATWWQTADMVAALPAAKGQKFYMLQDYEAFEFQPVDEVTATYRLPMHKIAVSSYIRDEITAKHGPMQIDVVNNAVDFGQFSSAPRTKPRNMTVGFLYNTHPRKQIGLAIDAVNLARQKFPDLRVIAFGGFAPSPDVPLPDGTDYHQAPDQNDIPKLYQSCDLWLLTSEKEGFGLPILEAMASRTPVLATPAGAAPDLIDGTNGVLMPEGAGPEEFCAQILAFADMKDDQWQTYSDAAYRTAQRNDWPTAARRLVETITSATDHDEETGL
jgi:glycosyltransferase involved in cell wall biosynthesis